MDPVTSEGDVATATDSRKRVLDLACALPNFPSNSEYGKWLPNPDKMGDWHVFERC
jgi:hypothetical protein